MKSRSRTIEQYFQTVMGERAWKQGRRIFEEQIVQELKMADGDYEAQLVEGRFEPQKTGAPVNIFVFRLPDGSAFEKRTPLHQPESVASLFLDLRKLGISVSRPEELPEAYAKIEKKKPFVLVEIETVMDIQVIRFLPHEKIVPFQPAAPLISKPVPPPTKTPLIETPPVSDLVLTPAAPPVLPPTEELPQSQQEVDIQPGHVIMVDVKGQTLKGIVVKTFEEEKELILQLPNGDKVIVPADSVVAKLA